MQTITRQTLMVLLGLSGLGAQTSGPAPPPATTEIAKTPPPTVGVKRDLTIGPNDTVTVVALNLDEISKSWRVSSSGDLNLYLVGRIHAAGMTVEELEQEIVTRLKQYVRDPQVTVHISQVVSRPLTVSGAVARPGVLQLDGQTTLFAILVQAGVRETATTVQVSRRLENGPIRSRLAHKSDDNAFTVVTFPLQSVMTGNGENANFNLLPDDIVSVSEERRSKAVYITGEVVKPGMIELATQDTVNLTKALAMAGGFTRLAKPSKTMIRHVNENGVETAMAFVDAAKVGTGKVKDLLLSDGDILVVPSNQWLSYASVASQSALSTAFFMLGRL
jgi:polysaccharide biosynthesis/export protein